MRIAVFSDIHAILEALIALKREIRSVDAYWCLGDLVGYGPYPNQVAEEVQRMMGTKPNSVCLLGNHDWLALGWLPMGTLRVGGVTVSLSGFQVEAERIASDHQRLLIERAPEAKSWMETLPVQLEPLAGFYLAHDYYEVTPPREKAKRRFTYLTQDMPTVKRQLAELRERTQGGGQPTRAIFVGHYHVAALWQWQADHSILALDPWAQDWYNFARLSEKPLIINVGTVSLPRMENGANATASYVLLDIDHEEQVRVGFRRLRYDWRQLVSETGPFYARYPMRDRLIEQIKRCALPAGST